MWSGQWNQNSTTQWPLHAAMYQNVPHEQVDWAQLAKQWIQMQQMRPAEQEAPPTIPPASIPSQPPPHVPLDGSNSVVGTSLNANSTSGGYWSNNWNENKSWQFEGPGYNHGVQPPEKETFDYGHVSNSEPVAAKSFDYNHGSDQYSYPQMLPPESAPYNHYWNVPPGTGPPMFKKEKDDKTENKNSAVDEVSPIGIHGGLNASKRKYLPAWIREGLEKMERDRQKKLKKEKLAKEKAEQAEKIKNQEAKPSETIDRLPKSKFDSESEDEKDVSGDEDVQRSPSPPVRLRSPQPVRFKTEEERQKEMMLSVRRMLTDLLLAVTNEELLSIAKDVYQKECLKGKISSGLTGYGSDSSGSDSEDDKDSEEELKKTIYEKRLKFSEWERKLAVRLDAEEEEEKRRKAKTVVPDQSEEKMQAIKTPEKIEASVSEKVTAEPNSEEEEARARYFFESKYNAIPGLDIGCAQKASIAEEYHAGPKGNTAKESETSESESSSNSSPEQESPVKKSKKKTISLKEERKLIKSQLKETEEKLKRLKEKRLSSSSKKSSSKKSSSRSRSTSRSRKKQHNRSSSSPRSNRDKSYRHRSRSRSRSKTKSSRGRSRSRSRSLSKAKHKYSSKKRSHSRSPSSRSRSSKTSSKKSRHYESNSSSSSSRSRSASPRRSKKRRRSHSSGSEDLGKRSSHKYRK